MTYIESNGTFAMGTGGNDTLVATSDHDCLYGGSGNVSFVLSANVLKDYNTVASEGYSMLGICDFASAGGTGGLGHQDYLDLRGFGAGATLNVNWENPVDSNGGRYIQYEVVDGANHYDFMLYSTTGATLVQGIDYSFFHG